MKPSPTICPACGRRCSGRKLRADEDRCPKCRKRKADPEPSAAKFAPGRGVPLTPEPNEDAEA